MVRKVILVCRTKFKHILALAIKSNRAFIISRRGTHNVGTVVVSIEIIRKAMFDAN